MLTQLCEGCGDWPATECPSATAYDWDGEGEDPNRPRWFCADCEDDYYSYYDELWNEYNAMVYEGIYR